MCGIWALFGCDEEVSKLIHVSHNICHRGPDAFRIESIIHYPSCCLGFYRLAIMDDWTGMQPLKCKHWPHLILIYNGEIYNYKLLAQQFGFQYQSNSDGECLLHLYQKGGIDFMCENLDGVFAFCLLDVKSKKVFVGRDTYGVRPCFKFLTPDGFLAVCSEVKGLQEILPQKNGETIEWVQPGYCEAYNLTDSGKVSFMEAKRFNKPGQFPAYKTIAAPDSDDIYENIRTMLTAAVAKRMMAKRRVGCMLSGGLDSSLVTGLVCKLAKEQGIQYPVQTFSIGMEGSPDVKAARKVADQLGTEHHEVGFTAEEGIAAVREVIHHLESYDITTIRASVGMYLISKYIAKNTDTIVVFSGEGADEVAEGYIYFHNAPTAEDGDVESRRLLSDLYMFDVLRADRTTSAHGLELRVPFLDHQFTSYYLSIPAENRLPKNNCEKYLIRKAFSETGLIPEEVLWRPKEAFSDGISSHEKSWYEVLQDHVDEQVNDEELKGAPERFPMNPPKTKEAYYYRTVFEELYPGKSYLVPYYWMPRWSVTDDPSARTLKHYKS